MRPWVGGSTSPLQEDLGCFVGERWRSGAPRQGWEVGKQEGLFLQGDQPRLQGRDTRVVLEKVVSLWSVELWGQRRG